MISRLERLTFADGAIGTASRASASTQFREITLFSGYRDIVPNGSAGDVSHVPQIIGPLRQGHGDLLMMALTLKKCADGFTTDCTLTKCMRLGYLNGKVCTQMV